MSGILSKIFDLATDEPDFNAIRKALKVYSEYKKHETEASEEERQQAEEALAFLKLNDNVPQK